MRTYIKFTEFSSFKFLFIISFLGATMSNVGLVDINNSDVLQWREFLYKL